MAKFHRAGMAEEKRLCPPESYYSKAFGCRLLACVNEICDQKNFLKYLEQATFKEKRFQFCGEWSKMFN